MSARLVIISGPGKGATYFLKDGQNVVGRGQDADIMLEHAQVSKRHCIVVYAGGKAEVMDAGSSNGTYLNGVLVKKKRLKVHDRLSVGPFVLEVIAGADARPSAGGGAGDALAYGAAGGAPAQPNDLNASSPVARSEREKSIFKKLFYKFDEVVPPVVYDFNTRHEWHVILSGLFLLYVFFYIGLSVYPLLETAKESVLREAERRAFYIARQIADLNQEAIANNQEALLTVDFAEKDQSVTEALIVDLGGRVLAPGSRVNESVSNPFIVKHLAAIREGNQKAWRLMSKRNEDATKVIVTVPIFARAPKSGLNVPKALVSVTFMLKGITLDSGTIGVVYFESLVIALLVGVFFVFLVYRMTYHSIATVNDDMDAVLKGNQPSVPKRYKLEPLERLIDSINSALSRIPNLKVEEKEVAATDNEQQIIDSLLAPIQLLVTRASHPMLLLSGDGKVTAMNTAFEDLTGIHIDSAAGQDVTTVARDDAFASMVSDLMGKAAALGLQGASEDYEFPSGLHRTECFALFSLPEKIEAYLFAFERQAEEGNG